MFGHQDSSKDDAKGKAGDAAGTRTVAPTAGSASADSSSTDSSRSSGGLASSLASSISSAVKGKPSPTPPPIPSTTPSASGSNATSTPLTPLDLKDIEKDLAGFEALNAPTAKSTNTPAPNPVKSSSAPTAAPTVQSSPVVPTPAPAPSRAAPTATSTPPTPTATATPSHAANSGDLQELKLAVVHELTPLVDELEQTDEEHFRTLMMMIQSAEEKTLLPKAYAAAHKIKSEKVRAQALLDVVNEINYFTQPSAEEE